MELFGRSQGRNVDQDISSLNPTYSQDLHRNVLWLFRCDRFYGRNGLDGANHRRTVPCTYIKGQKGNLNHVVATWKSYLGTETPLHLYPVVFKTFANPSAHHF